MAKTPSAPTRRAATSAPANRDSLGIPSQPAQTPTNAQLKQTSVDPTRSARTPTQASAASARQDSVETPTLPVKPQKFALFANQTLTAPTMLFVRMENACVGKASRLLAPSAWMLTSVAALQESVDLTPCARTPWGPTPAPAHLPLLARLPPCPAQNPVRVSPAASTPTVKPRKRTPTVSVRTAGHMTHRISLQAVSTSMNVELQGPVDRTQSAPTCPAAMCASASLATPATPWSAVWISTSADQSAPAALESPARTWPAPTSAAALRDL